MKRNIQLSDEVIDVLGRSNVSGDLLTLPGQLERKLYLNVDKALKSIGAKWDRKRGGHVIDPKVLATFTGKLAKGIAAGEVAHPNALEYYPTPPSVGARMADLAAERIRDLLHRRPENSPRVLEPSAGEGALIDELWGALEVAGSDPDAIYQAVVELDERRVDVLEERYPVDLLIHGDFLAVHDKLEAAGPFDVILMNPPFGSGLDVKHVGRALDLLAPGGLLISVVSGGFQTRASKQHEAVRAKARALGDVRYEPLPDDAFKSAGTSVRTKLLIVDRRP